LAVKTILEKLTALLATGAELKEAAVIGEEVGQYPQVNIDALTTVIEDAHAVAINETAEEPQQEAALTALGNAIKLFKGSVVKAPKTEPETVSLRGVVLKGADNFKKGSHSVHSGNGIVTFIDGKADVLPEVAAQLEKDGFIE
jgi:hypothetical protein